MTTSNVAYGTVDGPAYTNPDSSSTTTYSSDNKESDDLVLGSVRNLQYPLKGGNSHYVKFSINVTEESRLVRSGLLATDGYADYSKQDRAFKNSTSSQGLETGAELYAGFQAASATAGIVKDLFKKKGIGGARAATVGAAAIGAAAVAPSIVGSTTGITQDAINALKLTQRLKRLSANIMLYTPPSVKVNYNFSYDMPDSLIVHLAQNENFESIKSGLKAMTSGLTGFAGSVGKIARIVAATNSDFSVLSRTAANKKRDIMFQHVGNRVFQFEYVFAPRNMNEAKEVQDIIFMFKYFAHPEMLSGYGSFLYLYPAEFDIEYGIAGIDNDSKPVTIQNKHVNKISSCVLEAIDVDYSPQAGSFQSLQDGEPNIIRMSLQFREIESLHRDRIAEGY